MIDAAQAVMMAMANLQLIEPVVRAYQVAILQKGQWRIRDAFAERLGHEVITDPNRAYLMPDDDFAEYDRQCKAAGIAAGMKATKPENCPLLEAQSLLSDCENALIDTMSHLTKIESKNILVLGMAKRKEFIDLTLRLLAPFVTNPLPRGLVAQPS